MGDLWRSGDPVEILRRRLEAGGFLAVPTESSYALAADPRSAEGVAAIFRAKGREGGKPLPVVAADREQLTMLGVTIPEPLLDAAARWPAALTLVVGLSSPLPASAGRSTLAVRVPAHAGLRRLLDRLGTPLTATSANRSGAPPLLAPEDVLAAFPEASMTVVDAGELPGGPPSTLLALEEDGVAVLRRGRYPWPSAESEFSAGSVEISRGRTR
ncbi:MAG: L-threonylcarbamoyladenylate synthase [Thermoanaerobaculia bacterium]